MTNTRTDTIQCHANCCARTITSTPCIWECLNCGQLWDRQERGYRVWTPVQRAEHRALWAKALLSGEYRQGKEYLRRTSRESGEDLYTCTGVAVDICPFTYWRKGESAFHTALCENDTPNHLVPTLTVMNWLYLSSPQGHFKDLPNHPHLVSDRMARNTLQHLGDSGKADFPTIASIIESNPPGMFL